MNKRGFTLIELIAVITFVALIVLVSTPLILNQISTSRETKYKTFESDLCLATESYITNTDAFDNNDSFKYPGDDTYINVSDLISNGYVKKNTINPKTKEPIQPTDRILVTIGENGSYMCEFNGEQSYYNIDSANELMYDHTQTGLPCTNVQCALDKIDEMLD